MLTSATVYEIRGKNDEKLPPVMVREFRYGEEINIEGAILIDCLFKNCTFRGVPTDVVRCTFYRCDRGYMGLQCICLGSVIGDVFVQRPQRSDPRVRPGKDPIGCICKSEAHSISERCETCQDIVSMRGITAEHLCPACGKANFERGDDGVIWVKVPSRYTRESGETVLSACGHCGWQKDTADEPTIVTG